VIIGEETETAFLHTAKSRGAAVGSFAEYKKTPWQTFPSATAFLVVGIAARSRAAFPVPGDTGCRYSGFPLPEERETPTWPL